MFCDSSLQIMSGRGSMDPVATVNNTGGPRSAAVPRLFSGGQRVTPGSGLGTSPMGGTPNARSFISPAASPVHGMGGGSNVFAKRGGSGGTTQAISVASVRDKDQWIPTDISARVPVLDPPP